MFYQRINLRKLYENLEDDMPTGFNMQAGSEADMNDEEAISSSIGAPSASIEAQPSVPLMMPKEQTVVAKGNTYAFPITKLEYDELSALATQGAGVDWKGKQPLKMLTAGKDGGAATLTLGQSQKPVYLNIYLVNNKDEQKGIALDLEEDDRYYVAWITTPAAMLSGLAVANNVGNSIKVAVKTPLIDRGGQNVEHSLQVWKDFQSESTEIVDLPGENDTSDWSQGELDDYSMPTIPSAENVTVNTEDAMNAPGTAAGFEAAVESKAMSFSNYLKTLK